MSAFDELLEQRKYRKAKGGTAFDELLATREYNKNQKAAYNTLKGINLEGIQSAVAGENYIDRNTMDKYKYDLSTYIDNYSRLYTGNEDEKNKTLKDLTDFQNYFSEYYDYMTQFGNETEYNKNRVGWNIDGAEVDDEKVAGRKSIYDENNKRISEIDSLLQSAKGDNKKKLKAEREGLIAENNQYERGQKSVDSYYDIKNQDGFGESKKDYNNPTEEDYITADIRNDSTSWYTTGNGAETKNSLGEIVIKSDGTPGDNYTVENGEIKAKTSPVTVDRLGLYNAAKNSGYTYVPVGMEGSYDKIVKDGNDASWDKLTPDEENIYYWLLENNGQKDADNYLDSMTATLNRRAMKEMAAYIDDADTLERIALNIASVPASVFGGITGFIEDTANTVSGKEINPYSPAHSFTNFSSEVRSNTAQKIDEALDGAAIPLIDFSVGDAYQALMSTADSALGATLGGTGYGILMGMSSATSEARRLYEAGATNGQILWGGLLSGAAEMVFEKVSLDHFLKEGVPENKKGIIKNVLAQGGVEASEEVITEIANTISNTLVMRSQSDWEKTVQSYIDEGYSKSEANKYAFLGTLKEVVNAGLGGFISGGLHSGISSTIAYNTQTVPMRNAYANHIVENNSLPTLMDIAKSMVEAKDEALTKGNLKSLDKLANKADTKGGNKNIGALAMRVNNLSQTVRTADIKQQLTELGVDSKTAGKYAEVINKALNRELTDDDIDLYQEAVGTKEGSQVFEKMLQSMDNPITSYFADAIGQQTPFSEKYDNYQTAKKFDEETAKSEAKATDIPSSAPIIETPEITAPDVNSDIETDDRSESSLDNAIKEIDVNIDDSSLQIIKSEYDGSIPVAQFAKGMADGYKFGYSGVPKSEISNSEFYSTLSDKQKDHSYRLGAAAAKAKSEQADAEIKKGLNGKTGRRKGTVRGEGVKIADLKKAFNDTQNKAYKVLSTVSEATGVDIVLYKSTVNEAGEFVENQGKFKYKDNTIYIDINAGLLNEMDVNELGKYTMLRTFTHEFVHFIEKWNPVEYNAFRKLVFEELTNRGEKVNDLIEEKMSLTEGMSYDKASREVVAEAMTDMLPDSDFIQKIAESNPNVFKKLLEKLKEFLNEIKDYFNSIGHNRSIEANALKEERDGQIHYLESIIKAFDKVAEGAVNNYQRTFGTDDVVLENTTTTKESADPKTTTSEYGYTITDNTTYNSVEIKFNEKPSEAVRNVLKENKFRWNGKKSVWYGKTSRETITEALDNAYKAEVNTDEGISDFAKSFWSATQEERDEVIDAINENTKISHIAPTGIYVTENNINSEVKENVKETTVNAESEHKPKSRFPSLQIKNGTPSEKTAYSILTDYLRQGKQLTSKDLYAISDEAFGGTQSEGAYDRKDAYDAMELAVNKYLLETIAKYNDGTVENALDGLAHVKSILELLPTQNVRTQEMEEYQQFSTPPNIAYLAAWVANISNNDSVLEPSAGIGGLASFAKAWGAEVTVNELSTRRLEVLRSMGFDNIFNENAEQIDNILPDNIKPTVVIMNPPFSSTAGRTKNNKTSNAERHINQALERLSDGGRLVTILGKGMNNDSYYKYWDKVRKDYTIRANISIDGNNYKKYGTTFGVQIVVIDKTGPQGEAKTLTGSYTELEEIPKLLEGIRNDRSTAIKFDSSIKSNKANVATDTSRNNAVSVSVDKTDNSIDRSVERRNNANEGRNTKSRSNDTERRTTSRVQTTVGISKSDIRQEGTANTNKQNTEIENRDGYNETVDNTVRNDVSERREQRGRPDTESARSGEVTETGRSKERNDDGVFADYVTPEITVKGSKPHPAVLVESSAMSAVSMPKATYVPYLPENVIKNNLSTEQLVSITYAGQAHEQILPSGERKGFFIGDGTGVGKGRQISGIILDNFLQGRKKAVWVSMNASLYPDAVRDWTDTTGRSKDEIHDFSKIKLQNKIDFGDGILFTTYDTLRTEKGTDSRLNQIVEWLGKDFDGVIAFDEAHNMGNLLGKSGSRGKTKGSAKAAAAVKLQSMLPNARVVYVSATAATEVEGLAFASRLGLWGSGTAFADVNSFVANIGSSGLAAMELVIRDMKAMGVYVARSISYNGVNYETVQHNLDDMQTVIYDTMSEAWQKTMNNVMASLESTGAKYNSNARALAIGQYYSAMQRFYNQVLTSMSMPSVIADIRKELDAGRSCVLQIVNTNQAEADRQIAAIKAEGGELDDMDLTPRGSLIGYLTNCYPVTQFEEYTDDNGNLQSRPVYDSNGNPVIDKSAVRKRDQLIEEINEMSIPDGPLEMLFNAFGTEQVAEITGRTRRVVPKKMSDGTIKRVEERRSKTHTAADVDAFQDGKKRILIFSDAGGTGKSYHASLKAKNQQQRVHYVLQPGWIASKAVQGFGRTHRSNQASAPIYKLVTTNIKGQKRFTSTIARRLDQLGALTKGQRDTGSGMFGPKDNLETDLAKDSLREFYRRLGTNRIEGLDGKETLKRLGLDSKFRDQYGGFKLDEALSRDISTFLNRILALKVDEQNKVFDSFIDIYETMLEAAMQAGTLDTGMENVKADKVEIIDDKVIKEQENTGAATHYIQAKVYTKPKIITTVDEAASLRNGFVGIYKTKSGDVKAVYRIADKTTEWGQVTKQYRICGPNYSKYSVWVESSLENKAEPIPKSEWQNEWDKEVAKVPKYNEETKHMLTGTLLPIWNHLPTTGTTKVQRLIDDKGNAYLGRVIEADMIDGVLRSFNLGRTKETFDAEKVIDGAVNKNIKYTLSYYRAEIFRSKVSGEWRLEYVQPQNEWYIRKQYPYMILERINFRNRYFIPMNENGKKILDSILKENPVQYTSEMSDDDQAQSRAYLEGDIQYQTRTGTLTDREILEYAYDELDTKDFTEGEKASLVVFGKRLGNLKDLQEKRAEQGRLYKEQQFGAKVDRAAAAETLNRMRILDSQISKASSELLSVEEKEVLKRVLKKSRGIIEKNERAQAKERLDSWRERRRDSDAIKKYRVKIKADVDELSKWVLKPDNKNALKHIPDALKNTVIPFLTSIDFTSKRQLKGGEATKADKAFVEQLTALKAAMKKNIDINGMYSGYNDLPPNFMDSLQNFIDATKALVEKNSGEFVINKMTGAELKELSKIVRNLKKFITQMNLFHSNAMFKHVYEAGDNSLYYLKGIGDAGGKTGNISNYLLWQNMRPAYAFERFGEGGQAIYDEFRRAQATLAFNSKAIIDFTDKTYTEAEIKAWEKEEKVFELGGDEVHIPVSFIMSFYELSKQPDSLRHILGEGIRVATYKNGKTKISDNGHTLTGEDVRTIISSLSERQIEVADALQKFMATQGAKWGNYVSLARFGEELFTNPQYFPINSDGRHLDSTVEEHPSNASLYALLNMSFTKQRNEEANNRIILYSIFDVFANHMASMAQYNAFALPVLDAIKWFNYKETTVDNETGKKVTLGSVREEMSRVYGVPEESRPGSGREGYAETFVKNIIRAYNGTETQGISTDTLGLKALRQYNMSQIANNFRVVVQQPLAITRAGLLIDYSSILKGLKASRSEIKANIDEMYKHSGIAAWKSLGFYDINISRGLTDMIKHNSTAIDKVNKIGMWGAEKADEITWSAIWSACKVEVIKKQNVPYGTPAFFEAVTKLFEDVIYKTQVVDSVLTKTEFMRSKGFFSRAISSFMSEPVTTASMVISAYDKYQTDIQRGLSRQQAWQRNGKLIGRTCAVYSISAILLAAVQAVVDAWRDDDEDESYLEKYLNAFTGNVIDELMPFNKLPVASEFYDLAKELASIPGVDTYGNPPQSVFMQWYDSLVKGTEILYKKISGQNTGYTWYAGIAKMLKAVSGITGLPISTATREIIDAWNNTVGALNEKLKVEKYVSNKNK